MPHASTRSQRAVDETAPDDLGIVDALAQLSFLIQGILAKHAAAHDLSMIQTRLLGVLRDREPTMQQLARFLDLDKSSVTGLVNRAEKRGLVRRRPSADDRRAIHVALTRSGRRTVNVVADAFEADVAAATGCLSAAENKRLSTLATKIVNDYRPRVEA
jgi:DNA-binding MarR family transcriptional regulator